MGTHSGVRRATRRAVGAVGDARAWGRQCDGHGTPISRVAVPRATVVLACTVVACARACARRRQIRRVRGVKPPDMGLAPASAVRRAPRGRGRRGRAARGGCVTGWHGLAVLAPTHNYKWSGVQRTDEDGAPRTGHSPIARWTVARCHGVTCNGVPPHPRRASQASNTPRHTGAHAATGGVRLAACRRQSQEARTDQDKAPRRVRCAAVPCLNNTHEASTHGTQQQGRDGGDSSGNQRWRIGRVRGSARH